VRAGDIGHEVVVEFRDAIVALERRFWMEGEDFFRARLAPGCVMVLPEPGGVLEGPAIVAAVVDRPRWASVRIDAVHLVTPAEQSALLVYRASAARPDAPSYHLHATSLYVLQDSVWLLAFHQQTPLQDSRGKAMPSESPSRPSRRS
jgi:hypothetical protein